MAGDPLEYLFSLELFGVKLGLQNMHALVAELGHPERAYRSVHVAGTNGKGSVAALIEASLRAAGHRTGRYTSPHLVDLTERFAIDGRPVSDADLRSAVEAVRSAVIALQARERLDVHPTFFEVTTATAFELFRRAGVEVAVCEVGLGGRLDATNVLEPMVCAITSIAADHTQHLGTTLEAIAAEKAGIIKPGVAVIVGPLEPGVARVVSDIAAERGAPIVRATDDVTIEEVRDTDGGQIVRLQTRAHDYGEMRLGLAGRHQRANAAVAIRVLEVLDELGLPVAAAAIHHGFASVQWPGRLQTVHLDGGRDLLMDAAHNPAGAETLALHLAGDAPRPLVFAVMADKDIRGILHTLLPAVESLIVTRVSSRRSAEPVEVAAIARAIAPELSVAIAETPASALELGWQRSPRIVVAGSIFLLGDIMKTLPRS